MNVKEKALHYVSRATLLITALIVIMCMLSLTVKAAGEEAALSLEEAIRIARSAFGFNADELEFESFYSEMDLGYEKKATWRLGWSSEDHGEEYSIAVDAIEGKVNSYNYYKDSERIEHSKVAKYSEEEAKQKALEFISQIEPAKSQVIKYDEDAYDNAGLITTYNNVYNFRFYRVVEDIPFYDNYINVGVNKDTLEITFYNIEWNREEVTPIEPKLLDEEIKNIIDSKVGIELMYMLESDKNIYKNVSPLEKDDKKNARLVYVLKDYDKVIDAVTGEVVRFSSYDKEVNDLSKTEAALDSTIGGGNIQLSESELKEINNIISLLSKEKAYSKVSQYIDSGYKLSSSNISKYNDNYVWSFSFSKAKNNEESGYGRATVDAITGEVKSFYVYDYDDNDNDTIRYTYEEAKKLADRFLNKIQPSKVEITKLEENKYKEKSESYTYTYTRLFNGVKAPFNSISITVDGSTGKITRYNMNWFDFNDKSNIKVEDAISVADAYKALYTFSPLELRYINHIEKNTKTVRLVYGLSYDAKVIIDALDSRCLDSNLKEINDEEENTFKDIDGHWAEETIRKLNSYGVIESEEYFNPSNIATQKDVIKMMLKGLYSSAIYSSMTDDDYYRIAIDKGMIEQNEKDMEKQLNRLDVAKLVACTFGYRELVMPNSKNYDASIFTSKYFDVEAANRGIVAVASTFNIMKGNGRYFSPNNQITKAEVATIVLNMMNR